MPDAKLHFHEPPACPPHTAVCAASCAANAIPGETIVCGKLDALCACTHWPPLADYKKYALVKKGAAKKKGGKKKGGKKKPAGKKPAGKKKKPAKKRRR